MAFGDVSPLGANNLGGIVSGYQLNKMLMSSDYITIQHKCIYLKDSKSIVVSFQPGLSAHSGCGWSLC